MNPSVADATLPARTKAKASPATATYLRDVAIPSALKESTTFDKDVSDSLKMLVAPLVLFILSTRDKKEFSILCHPLPKVLGIDLNSSSIFLKPFKRAGITTSVTSPPSAPIFLSSPFVLPSPSAKACATRGACSITELSS